MRKKIALIGGGNIGGTLAYTASLRNMGDIVILDRNKDFATGKALDIKQSLPIYGCDVNVIGTDDYKDISNADVVIITAGSPRKPGMTREDLMVANAGAIKEVSLGVKKYAKDSFVIVITNPLDVMSYAFIHYSGFSRKNVVGMAGVLDTSRFKLFLAEALDVSVKDIVTFVLGTHGDSMVPLIRLTTVSGIPLSDFLKKGEITHDQLHSIIDRTKNGGKEIVDLMKTGSAFYAPAASAIEMADAYLYDKQKILPCSVFVEGEYGFYDKCLGLPTLIGGNGVEKIIEIDLTSEEHEMLKRSADEVEAGVRQFRDLVDSK